MDSNEARDDGAAVASDGPYANNLHLDPDRLPCQHSSFYKPDALPDAQPSVSKHANKKLCHWPFVSQLGAKYFTR